MLTEKERKRLGKLVRMLGNGLVWQRGTLLKEIEALLRKLEVKK